MTSNGVIMQFSAFKVTFHGTRTISQIEEELSHILKSVDTKAADVRAKANLQAQAIRKNMNKLIQKPRLRNNMRGEVYSEIRNQLEVLKNTIGDNIEFLCAEQKAIKVSRHEAEKTKRYQGI